MSKADINSNKLNDVVNIKDFGAIGNGSADDTTAFAAALAWLNDGGRKSLYLPAGQYLTSEAFQVTASNVSIVGDGPSVTRWLHTSTTGNVIQLGSSSATISNVLLRGIAIDTPSAVTKTSGSGVNVENVQLFILDDLTIYKMPQALEFTGTNIDSTNSGFIRNIHIRNGRATSGSGIWINKAVNLFFSQITMNAPSGSKPGNGILINECQAAWFSGIDILNHDIGFHVLGNSATGITTWLFMSQVTCDNCGIDGIRIRQQVNGGIIKGLSFDQCWSASNGTHGVNIFADAGVAAGAIDGINFDNHISLNNGQHGFRVRDVVNFEINGGRITGNSQTSSGTYNGVQIEAGTSQFAIRGVRIGTVYRYTASQARGVLVPTGASDNYMIVNNDLRGNLTAGLTDNGTGLNKVVTNNLT